MADVCSDYGLAQNEVDAEYGIVQTDFVNGLYVILVYDCAQEKIRQKLKALGAEKDPMVGIFANPSIAPFGPPERE